MGPGREPLGNLMDAQYKVLGGTGLEILILIMYEKSFQGGKRVIQHLQMKL